MRMFLLFASLFATTSAYSWGIMGEMKSAIMSGAHTQGHSVAQSAGTGYSAADTSGWSMNVSTVRLGTSSVRTQTDGMTKDEAWSTPNAFGFSESKQMGWAEGESNFTRRFMR